ncbi:YdeI/OmpD-associated family protein [Acidiluteibacter ferrifornacis]|uniref:YdhG-like domain-containing protein n=1 Tax=Acidiluteibacter ferrifornacis TaxID=2692424 RepID=A0A6N9NJU7_9FLAO|nr:YdeI/OmpD-associated family protein [Acidiluteibacter ferrifornacis]NBG65751.1 hypothetical protein [Acidiluteibacter ferrifornacis]
MDKVDTYIQKKKGWEKELIFLRELIGKTELVETIKWGSPVYTIDGKNVLGMAAFKSYVGIWFFQGVFLSDPHRMLVNAQDGVTKALRQIRFQSIEEMDASILLEYFHEAIQNQKEGKELKPSKAKEIVIPAELKAALNANNLLNEAFNTLTLGKQKEYAEYIEKAKREATKISRLEKIVPMILSGIGLYDKYKNC